MPFPSGWPPTLPAGRRSLRFFKTGSTTTLFEDNAFLFVDEESANTFDSTPTIEAGDEKTTVSVGSSGTPGVPFGGSSAIWADTIEITNEDGTIDLEFSFDGTNVHGVVPAGTTKKMRPRAEAGIAVRSSTAGAAFRIEAW